jgi:hypothetical protein
VLGIVTTEHSKDFELCVIREISCVARSLLASCVGRSLLASCVARSLLASR